MTMRRRPASPTVMADLIDTEVAGLLLAEFEATLAAIWADMTSELVAYVMAHVDCAERKLEEVEAITGHALALAEVARACFSVDLDAACVETERQFFDEARPQ